MNDDDNLFVLPGAEIPDTPDDVDAPLVSPTHDLLLPAIEACLFAMPGVVTLAQLMEALKADEASVSLALEKLTDQMSDARRGVRLVRIGNGWQFRTDPRFAAWVAAVRGGRPARLSRAALETLAIIAFRQPVSKGAVDDLRGVDCGAVLKGLSERGLVRVTGRSEDPGHPLTYGTTPAFLEMFGLRSLADLPTLKDLRALQEDGPVEPDAPVLAFPVAGPPESPEPPPAG